MMVQEMTILDINLIYFIKKLLYYWYNFQIINNKNNSTSENNNYVTPIYGLLLKIYTCAQIKYSVFSDKKKFSICKG